MMDDLNASVKTLIESLPFKAAVLAGILTMLRFFYIDDRRKGRRKFLEMLLCVVSTYGIVRGAKALPFINLDPDVAWLIAVGMGWYGTSYVQEKAKSMFEKRVEEKNEAGE